MNSGRKRVKNEDGIISKSRNLNKLFMRKSGLPVLKVRFQMVQNNRIGIPLSANNSITNRSTAYKRPNRRSRFMFITAKINEAIAEDKISQPLILKM
jgi:sucrose phosphorylase